MDQKEQTGRKILRAGGILALVAGLVFVFGAINASAGCCCYGTSCLNLINGTESVNATNAYLKVDKFVDRNVTRVGDDVGYTIIVRNLGNNTAYDVTVNDILPVDIAVVDVGAWNAVYARNQNGDVKCHFEMNASNITGKILKCTIPKLPRSGTVGNNVTIFYKAKVLAHTNAPVCHTNNVSVNGFYAHCQRADGVINQTFDGCPCTSLDICNQVYGETDIAKIQPEQYGASGSRDLRSNVTVCIVGIKITKTGIPSRIPIQPGDIVTFNITVTNTGDLPICNISIYDRLPVPLEFVNVSGNTSPISFSNTSSRDVHINVTTCLSAPGTFRVNISARARAICNITCCLRDENFVNVSGRENASGVIVSDNFTTTLQQVGKADISWTKEALNKTIFAGQIVTYRITVINRGTGIAHNVTIIDYLPRGVEGNWTYEGGTSITDTCTGTWSVTNVTGWNIIRFFRSSIDPGTTCSFEFNVSIPAGTTEGVYANTIRGNWTHGDGVVVHIGNRTPAEANVFVAALGGAGGIGIKKESDKNVYKFGEIINYTITVYSYGIPTTTLTVRDVLPKGLRLVNCTNTTSLPAAPSISMYTTAPYPHHCNITYTQRPNNFTTFLIRANVTEDISDQQITNTVTVNGTLGDTPLYAESTKSVSLANPRVTISKWADASDVQPGQRVTFYVLIQNPSETNLINLTVRDVLPRGFEYVHNSSMLEGMAFNETSPALFNVTPPTYNVTANQIQQNITWNISNIPERTTMLLTFKANVHCNITTGNVTNRNNICINGTTYDNASVGACTHYDMTGHIANMTVRKYANINNVKWFDVVEYTIIIRNPMHSAHSILKEINDTLAPRLRYINNSATLNGEAISPIVIGNHTHPNGTQLIWNGSPINNTALWVGTTVVLKYKVLVMPGTDPILRNNVTVRYYDPPPNQQFDPRTAALFNVSTSYTIVRAGYIPQQEVVSSTAGTIVLDTGPNALTTYTISLKKGWNLISLPIQPQDTSIDSVLHSINGKYTDVLTYINGNWAFRSIYKGKTFGTLDKIESGRGYWIKVDEDCTLSIEGIRVKSISIPLKSGWNIIGPIANTPVANLNVPYTSVFGYDSETGWKHKSKYMGVTLGTLNEMVPGKGYWIKVTSGATLEQ